MRSRQVENGPNVLNGLSPRPYAGVARCSCAPRGGCSTIVTDEACDICEPILAGGQGRDAEDIERDGWIAGIVLVAAVVVANWIARGARALLALRRALARGRKLERSEGGRW